MLNLPKGAKPLVPGDEMVEIKHGPSAPTIARFRDTENQRFVFVQFQDNATYQSMAHDDWHHHAKGAIERFLATRGLALKGGVMTGATGPFDFFAEFG